MNVVEAAWRIAFAIVFASSCGPAKRQHEPATAVEPRSGSTHVSLDVKAPKASALPDDSPRRPRPPAVVEHFFEEVPASTQSRAESSDKARPRGLLKKEAIRRVIHKRINGLRWCWERALQRDPQSTTQLVARFVIDPHGRVESAEASGGRPDDSELKRCVIDWIKGLVFPAPKGNGYVGVTYPLWVDTA